MIMVRFARSASVNICLYALSVILLFPFNAFAQREYGSSPHGFAFDTQLCYREECDKVANTKYELPCCRELCNWKSCVSNSHDPQAAGRTECQPHYQIYTNCLKKAKASKNPPAPKPVQASAWNSGHMEQQNSKKGEKFNGEIVQFAGTWDKCTAIWKAFNLKRNKVDGNWPITISFSNSIVTVNEHHSSQIWVGTCVGSQNGSTITCSGKETTKGDFTFTITLRK